MLLSEINIHICCAVKVVVRRSISRQLRRYCYFI